MASNDPEELPNNNTETDEGTIALHKKRSRRVSFAENTSIHVFDRDEEFETPPDAKPYTVVNDTPVIDDEMLLFSRNMAVGDDFNDLPSDVKEHDCNANNGEEDDDDNDAEIMNGRKSFFRSVETPSPGSTIGSATPIGDEEDYFGPVEPNFIRPGRYSDSGVSEDDNRDVTMDSTAFSMHFRSLARSESEVDLKTPSRINLYIEQKTPTGNTNSGETGRFMVLTRDKKCILSSSLIVDKGSHSKDSNDMSLVGENPNRYDYSKLSPTLDALLADENTDLLTSTPSYPTKESETPRVSAKSNSETNLKDSVEVEPANDGFHDRLAEAETFPNTELSNDNGCHTISIEEMAHTSDDGLGVHASFLIQTQTSDHVNHENHRFNPSKEAIDDELEIDRSKTNICDSRGCNEEDTLQGLQHDSPNPYGSDQLRQSPLTAIKSSIARQRHANSPRNKIPDIDAEQNYRPDNQSALAEVESSLSVKDWKAVFDSGNSPRQHKIFTPEKWTGSILRQESIRQIISASSIQKSISKLNILSSSPNISSLQDKDGRMKRRLSNVFSIPSFDSNSIDPISKDEDRLTVPVEEQLLKKDQKNAEYVTLTHIDSSHLETPKTLKNSIQTPETSTYSVPAVISSPLTMSGLKMSHYFSVSSGTTSLEETILQYGKDLQKEAEAFNLQTPLRKIETSNNEVGNPDESLQTVKGPDMPKMTLRGGNILSSPGPYVSSLVSRRSTAESLLKKGHRSPSRKHSADMSQTNNVHHGIKSPNGHKRQRGELVLMDENQIQETSGVQHSPQLRHGGLSNSVILLKQLNESNDGGVKVAAHLSLEDSFEMLSRFSAESGSLHSPLMDKLNLRAVGVLEDILVNMQKVKNFEVFYSQIQSQKVSTHSNELRHKRVSERRLLLCKMVYEQSKLQLMQKKRERLLKKVNELNSGTQECLKLKMDYFQDLSVPSAKVAQVDDSLHPSFPVHAGLKHAVSDDKITTMNQEAEALERKIKELTQNLHIIINLKGELSLTETVLLVKEHLNKRTCCRSIRQDLQLWKVDRFESRKGQHNIVINYHGFVCQRFTLSAPASSIIVANEMNEANIVKKFPNMDACTAFAFVVKTESQRKISTGRYIAQETQIMSSFLCNLLDVIEDVCRARLELCNLTDTKFHSPSAERLDLLLYFREHKSGEMLSLALDMSCLNCGVYPKDVFPSRLEYSSGAGLGDEIRGAMDSLKKGGYTRISSLLKCISQTLDAFFNNQVKG